VTSRIVHPGVTGGLDASGDSSACLFCRIGAGIEPAEIVYADDVAVAFLDVHPLFHGHTLVVPRQHVVTLADLDGLVVGSFFARVRSIAAQMPSLMGCQGTFVAINNVVSQSVAHLHVHVVPRSKGDGLRGFFWPRTKYVGQEMSEVGARLRAGLSEVEI
jgi:histidine triad (HIT) family protein